MIARLLGWLFPPILPGRVRDWEERIAPEYHEQGWAGKVQRKYRDGIDRHFSENPPVYRASRHQWNIQLSCAQEQIAEFETEMEAQGYVNTIHDCWEKTE